MDRTASYLHSDEKTNHHKRDSQNPPPVKKQKSSDKLGHFKKVVLGSRVPFVFTSCIIRRERRFSTIMERRESAGEESGRMFFNIYVIYYWLFCNIRRHYETLKWVSFVDNNNPINILIIIFQTMNLKG